MNKVVVIGVGNPYRNDDAAGIEAARLLRKLLPEGIEVVEHDGEPAAMLDLWEGSSTAYVIDAIRSDDPPGTVHRAEVGRDGELTLAGAHRRDSSHALGLGDAVELGRVLDRLPERLVLIGITGASFEVGDEVGASVRKAVAEISEQVAREVGVPEVGV